MFCNECGNKLKDNAKFCGKCGAPVKPAIPEPVPPHTEPTHMEPPHVEPPRRPGSKRGMIVGILVFLLVLAAAGTAAIVYLNRDVLFSGGREVVADKDINDSDDDSHENKEEQLNEGIGADDGESEDDEPIDSGNEITLAENELSRKITAMNEAGQSVVSLSIFEENYVPGTRNVNYAWDRTLFYSLEDIDPNSAADGLINGYGMVRKMLKNADSGNKMEYEIYSNPSIQKVNKIVSIEYMADHLEITDYYYNDAGKVSFIFVRNDINYIPSYAVPTKDGQRFYYNSDCMVKWRVVSDGVQTNYVIGNEAAKNNPSGTVILYSALDAAAKENYDTMEKGMLNAAYNTYNMVIGAEGVSEITGYVYDEDGSAKPSAKVVVYEGEDGLYQTETDTEGLYEILLPSEERTYRLKVSEAGYVETDLYDITISDTVLSEYQDTVYLVENSDQMNEVTLLLCDALNYAAGGVELERLSGAAVYVRDGMNHRTGNVVAQGTADSDGVLNLSLKPGMYTAQIEKPGYDFVYYNFAVKKDMQVIQINASPVLAEGEVRIVLTWGEQPYDLDSHLFTPYDSTMGDSTYHIWYGNMGDGAGNSLDVDDITSYGPETITIPALKNGLYKYYVADFTNCLAGNPTSSMMSLSGASVNVYTSAGLTATFHVPANTPGVIWEVFEIRNGVIVPIQRYYANIEDKSWWHNDK